MTEVYKNSQGDQELFKLALKDDDLILANYYYKLKDCFYGHIITGVSFLAYYDSAMMKLKTSAKQKELREFTGNLLIDKFRELRKKSIDDAREKTEEIIENYTGLVFVYKIALAVCFLWACLATALAL